MRKAPALKEAGPACALFARFGRSAEFATKNLARAREVPFSRRRSHTFCGFIFHAPGAQVLADARRAILARELARALLGVAFIGELLLRLQRIEQRHERLRGIGVRPELARELGAGVLAAREQP